MATNDSTTSDDLNAKAQHSEQADDREARQRLAIHAACAVDALVQTLRREVISGDDDVLFVEYTLDSTLRRIRALNQIVHSVLNGDELDIDEMSVTITGRHLDGSLAD